LREIRNLLESSIGKLLHDLKIGKNSLKNSMIDPKINIYTKTSMIIYKLRCRTCLEQWNYSMELGETGKGKENDRASVISHNIIRKGKGYKDLY
jgi:hypothetical protein